MKPPEINEFEIRLAKVSEADYLTSLADRSKSYWPYDAEYLKLCRAVTKVTVQDIEQWPVLVAVKNENILGFAALSEINGEKMLDHLWIEPAYIGRGVGRELFLAIAEKAQDLGWAEFVVASDPYAEKFYLTMGATRIGERVESRKGAFPAFDEI